MTDIPPDPESPVVDNGGFQPDVVPRPDPIVPLESKPPRPVSDYNDNEEDIYQNPIVLESEPLQIEDLPEYIIKMQDGPKGFSPEFAVKCQFECITKQYE